MDTGSGILLNMKFAVNKIIQCKNLSLNFFPVIGVPLFKEGSNLSGKIILPVGLKFDSFIQLEGRYLQISTIKKNEFEDKLVVRVYNPTNRKTTGKIKLGFDVYQVYLGKIDESYREKLHYDDGVKIYLGLKR